MTDFIKYRNKNLRVVYVDPSLNSGLNTGDDVTDALQQLPAVTALSANAAYVIRRTPTPAIIRKGNCPNNNVLFIGMPSTSGQMFYSNLPPATISAWAGDVTPITTVYVSGYAPNTPLRFGLDSSYGGYGLFNINFLETELSNQKYGLVHAYGGSLMVDNCTFSISGYPVSGNLSHSLSEWTGLHVNTAEGLSINKIYSYSYGYGNTYSSPSSYTIAAGLFVEGGGSNCSITNSTFRIISGTNYNNRSFGIKILGTVIAGTFKNLNFFSDGIDDGLSEKVSYIRIDTVANGCVFENISGSGGYFGHGGDTNLGITIDYGTSLTDNAAYSYKRKSSHTFKNIYFFDGGRNYTSFSGINLGSKFHDCTFENISIIAPSASNYIGQAAFVISDYSTHNKIDNIYIDYGSAQNHPISNNNNCYGFYIGGNNSNQKHSKNFLSNAIIKCCKVGIYSLGRLDITNTSITGSLQAFGDSLDVNILETPNKSDRYSTNPEMLYHLGGGNDDASYRATGTVFRIKEFINRTTTGRVLNYGTSKVSIENMTGAGTTNTLSTNSAGENCGVIYQNNYPQTGFWLAQNAWHRFDTSVVQFVTVANISSGYSLAYTHISTTNWPTPYSTAEQALVISPQPYIGSVIPTTSSMSANTQHTAVLYFATKYESSPVTSTELWFDLEIPSGSTGTDTRILTTRGKKDGVILDTSGTAWSGDSPIVLYKIELPFMLDRSENVYSRIYWNKSMPGGTAKAFIAPRIIIE